MSVSCLTLFLPEFRQLATAPGLSGVDARREFSSLSHTQLGLCVRSMGHLGVANDHTGRRVRRKLEFYRSLVRQGWFERHWVTGKSLQWLATLANDPDAGCPCCFVNSCESILAHDVEEWTCC